MQYYIYPLCPHFGIIGVHLGDPLFPCKQSLYSVLGTVFTSLSLGLTGWWECLCNSPSLHGPDSGGGGRPHCTGNLTTGGGGEECSGGGGGHEPRCMSVRTTGSPPGKEVSSSFFSPFLPPPSLSPFLPPSLPPSLLPYVLLLPSLLYFCLLFPP